MAVGAQLSGPAVAILLVLALLQQMPVAPALGGALAVFAGCYWMVRRRAREGLQVADYVERLDGEPAAGAPLVRSAEAARIVGAAAHLKRQAVEEVNYLGRQLEVASAILDALHDPLMILDRRRSVIRANTTAVSHFGAKILNRDLAETLRHPDVLAAVDEVLAGGGSRNVQVSQPVPVEKVFEIRVVPFQLSVEGETTARRRVPLSGSGELGGAAALLTLHDITAIKRSEQMRADFVANASHELRTPLSTLIGFIETLRGPARDDPAAQDRFLSIMEEQAGRMSRLVNDLMSLSRIELDEHTPPVERVEIPRILRTVVDMLELRAKAHGVSLVIDQREPLPLAVGDEDQLVQVFQNLILNAIRYGRDNGAVTIRAYRSCGLPGMPGGSVAVAVIDEGEGIERSHLPRLTERFYRVDPARSRAMGGTGLGLAIVKHIVSRHRGRLIVDSELGRGSTFTVHLPAAAPGDRVIEAAPAAAPAGDAVRRTAAAGVGP